MKRKNFLRARDLKLLCFLCCLEVSDIETIRFKIFAGIGKNHVYARLKQLVLMGFLQKVPYQRKGRFVTAYALTRQSFKFLTANSIF